jgi:hypothetical protein
MNAAPMGFQELILILMSLGGFGVAANPGAPPAAEILRYAPDDAEVMGYLDVEAVVPKNWDAFKALPQQPTIKASPRAVRALADAIGQVEAARAQVKAAAGFDPVTDVKSVAGFVTFHGKADPSVLVAVRGRFAPDTVERIGKQVGGTTSVVDGRALLVSPDASMAVALAADGTLLGGTTAWVKQRVQGWQPRRGPLGDKAGPLLDERPFFHLSARLAPATVKQIVADVSDPGGRDVLTGAEHAALSLYWNGVGWTFTARTAAGFARGLLATEGLVPLLRAGHLYLRGLARVGLAMVDSYPDPAVAQVAAHKADLIKLVDSMTGDGSFAVALDRKESERRVSVRLTSKSLSEVLPVAGLMIPGAVAWAALNR